MVAAPLLDSSSGCACTAMSRSGPEYRHPDSSATALSWRAGLAAESAVTADKKSPQYLGGEHDRRGIPGSSALSGHRLNGRGQEVIVQDNKPATHAHSPAGWPAGAAGGMRPGGQWRPARAAGEYGRAGECGRGMRTAMAKPDPAGLSQ